ncbi:MAG: aminoacyltransferase [Firmicutes bacterium]|jgi:hypothetical protein|nr:aminoacyltransferase [Bacillota bacterium]
MKRLAYGVTIGLVGVLAAMAVKFPATQEVSLPGDTSVPHTTQHLVDWQNQLEPIRPLVIDRGAPTLSLPGSEDFRLNELADISLSDEVAPFSLDIMSEEANNQDSRGETDSLSLEHRAGFACTDVGETIEDTLQEHEPGTPAPAACIPEDDRTGYVLLDEVMKKHPLWIELVRIEREIEASKSRWRSYVDASGLTEEDMLKCIDAAGQVLDGQVFEDPDEGLKLTEYSGAVESRLALMETSLIEEAEARIEAKRMELQAHLDDRLYAEQARLNNEFDEFRDRVVKESYVTIVNIQMKLQLLGLPDAQRDALEEELRCLTDEVEAKLHAKRKALDDAYALYEAREIAEDEENLARYGEEQAHWVASQLQEERERVAKEFEGLFSDTLSLGRAPGRGLVELSTRHAEISREFKAREVQFTEELGELTASRNETEDCIMKDIDSAVSSLKDKTGINIELVQDDSEAGGSESVGIDMTPDIIRIIRDYE